MRRVNFNNQFLGFEEDEDILLDTNIIYAFLNPYDSWHSTVKNLFNNHIFPSNVKLYLYTHSSIVNEVTYLSRDPLKKYSEHHGTIFSEQDIAQSVNDILDKTKQLIEQDILLLLESNKESIYKQIDFAMYFGAMDSLIVSLVNEYGMSLLTTDTKLLNNLSNKQNEFPNIRNVYFTNGYYRDY
ncbi:MAG: hypothetical protein WA131_04390 [Desulfitobacteriaceae bacterium]